MARLQRTFLIVNALGLHARAAAQMVQTANRFQSEVLVERDGQSVNGKSIMGVLMLAAAKGTEIEPVTGTTVELLWVKGSGGDLGTLTESGLADVETYIQSGNVRFATAMRSPAKVERHVEEVLGEHCGFDVPSVILTPRELRRVYGDARAVTPPPFADPEGKQHRYVTFFKAGQAPTGEDAERIAAWDAPGESAVVVGRATHIWLDHGTQDAQFFKAFKKALAPGTNRDLKVVTALDERWGA